MKKCVVLTGGLEVSFSIVDSIDSLKFVGSDLFPPLNIGNTLAQFISLEVCPVCILLLIRIAIIGLRLFYCKFEHFRPRSI